ncbi:MAG: cation transporter [Deltaproteobacteria bacterium]|nr:cation transporter [Deltaproteobacteria bacterium]
MESTDEIVHGPESSETVAHLHEPTGVCSHQHVDVKDTSGSRLLLTLALNLMIPVAQVIGGFYAHSMALISDATHNFSDFVAILLAYIAHRIGKKGASFQNTFGYKRAEILAATLNVAILIGASAFIVYGAVERFYHPQHVLGKVVILLASVGILGNGFSAWLLHRDSKHSLNVRGAFLHMMGDLLTSVMVLINGVVLMFRPWYWLDPLLSMLIVVFILKNCWSILKASTGILMNATPKGLDLEEIKEFLEQIPDVCRIHYLHAWNISATSIGFSCHVEVLDQRVSQTEKLGETIRHELFHRFGIDHPVLQFETAECGNGGILCEISSGGDMHG